MPHPGLTRSCDWLWGISIFLVACVVYLPVLHGGFVWDDIVMVTENPSLRGLHGLHDIWFTTKTTDVYPITFTTLWIEWQCWGSNPLGYHIVNVLLHATGAVLLWRLLRRLSIAGSAVAALTFAVHPISVASVAWISERKNTLAFVFFLLTLLAYERFNRTSAKRWYFNAMVLFVFALLSKASVVTLPALLLLLVWWQTGRISRKTVIATMPFFALSTVCAAVTVWNQHYHAIGDSTPQHHSFIEKLAGSGCAVAFYIWKDLFPIGLSAIYPQWKLRSSDLVIYLPLAVITTVVMVAWRNRKTWGRPVLFAIGYVVLVVFPVMGFFDMYYLTYSRVADHLEHLALPGCLAFYVAVGSWLCFRLKLPKLVAATAVAAITIAFAAATWIRADVYTTEEKLWSDTVKKNPNAWMAYNNLGNALFGDKKFPAAETAYRKALELNPDFPDAHSNLGNLLVETRRLDEAVEHLSRATQIQTNNAKFFFNLGVALAEKHRTEDALNAYTRALQLHPRYAEVHNNMAHLLLRENKPADALAHALTAVSINGTSAEAHFNAAEALSALDRNSDAIGHYQAALAIRPSFATAHHSLGLVLAMNNKVDEALPHFREAARLQPTSAGAHASLGNALAITKHLHEAIAEYELALKIDPQNADTHSNLANALSEAGRFSEASTHYATALKFDPQNANGFINYGMTLQRQGKFEEARAQYEAALRLKPNDESLRKQISTLANQ